MQTRRSQYRLTSWFCGLLATAFVGSLCACIIVGNLQVSTSALSPLPSNRLKLCYGFASAVQMQALLRCQVFEQASCLYIQLFAFTGRVFFAFQSPASTQEASRGGFGGRQLLQENSSPAAKVHRNKLHHVSFSWCSGTSNVHDFNNTLAANLCTCLYQQSRSPVLYSPALQVHGWLMCLSWGFLIPLGVVIACFRTVRGMGTWWYHLHRALQILGFLVSLAGLSVGVYLDPGQGGLFWQHKIIGIVVNVLALVQVGHKPCMTL